MNTKYHEETTPKCERNPKLYDELEAQKHAIDELAASVGELIERIAPLLRPQEPCDECGKATYPDLPPVLQVISNHNLRLFALRADVGSAISRLAL
jgi:hypothetical protein